MSEQGVPAGGFVVPTSGWYQFGDGSVRLLTDVEVAAMGWAPPSAPAVPSRVSVDAAALQALIDYADTARVARDGEFCVGLAEFKASEDEFRQVTAALDVRDVM